MRLWAGIVAFAMVCAASAVAAAAEPERKAAGGADQLAWRPCEGGECAQLAVPRDYDKPNGPTIDVALFRIPAANPSARVGAILGNPGGPGASGVNFMRQFAGVFPQEIRDRFDLVGFDPRGTGETIPIDCTDSLEPLLDLDYSPDSEQERKALATAGQDFADACEERSGESLRYIATVDTARDMDQIRAALGDDQLSYLGFSYGTYLGALYAELFPKRVRAFVLDGPLNPALAAEEFALSQAGGAERALEAFFTNCGSDTACPFQSGGDPAAAFDELQESVESTPIPSADGRELGPNDFSIGVFSSLYHGEPGYGELADALATAASGDPSGLFTLADQYTERNEDGTYSNNQEAYVSIWCRDREPIPARSYERLERRFDRASAHFGLELLYELRACSDWPVKPVRPLRIDAKGSVPILVVAATGDFATPYEEAEELARQLDSGVLLTVENEAHTSYRQVSDCVDNVVNRYLIDLEVPEPNTRCE